MDIQYILDPYACIVYIINYITKKEGHVSRAVKQADTDTKDENVNMKTRKIGNAILNNQEVSAEEAAHYLLGYPFTYMSTQVQFINTRPAEDSMRITKPVFSLESLSRLSDLGCRIFLRLEMSDFLPT